MGRSFTDPEGQSNAQVAILSDKFWRTVLHGDPEVVGKIITLDAKPYSVIGVMPPRFNQPPQTEVWIPMSLTPSATSDYDSAHRFIRVLGRLKAGVSVAQAQARMDTLERRVAALHPATGQGNTTLVVPLTQQLTGDLFLPTYVRPIDENTRALIQVWMPPAATDGLDNVHQLTAVLRVNTANANEIGKIFITFLSHPRKRLAMPATIASWKVGTRVNGFGANGGLLRRFPVQCVDLLATGVSQDQW